ncbi:hypothetical protein G3I40_03385 [Streptomyces sp. SID14478]|uniref:hypothetical protein n=1 Tax=Streptomyces sp. SID14478 TaxID=2706073 RepID=UPI0013DC8F73|nr:hypothetical protein [Streptomyces sp. SID14478]NEB74285.1 hypothetical protein [Streptomyces sp. SID14478]
MRLRNMMAVGAAVLVLTAVSGCGSDEGGEKSSATGGDGYGQSAGSGGRLTDTETNGRPSAGTMADIETFVSQRTTCTDLHPEDKDSDHEDDPDAESVGKLWGIKERAVCWDVKGNGVTLISINDMKSFQTQAEQRGPAGYLLGEDFAVTGGPTTRAGLKDSGLLALVCDPETQIPSGYTKEKGLVDGCTLTDFVS